MNNLTVIGADSETCNGAPFTFQFYSQDTKGGTSEIVWTDGKHATRDFLKWCSDLPAGNYIIFVHNLEFDLVSFFYDRHIIFTNGKFSFTAYGWEVEGLFDKPVFATLHKGNTTIYLRDTGAWYAQKLAKLAELFTPHLPKLSMPTGLGKKIFERDDSEFIAYAMRDAEIAYHIGKYILQMHNDYHINLTVSAPHMAACIFRKHHLKESIPLPSKAICYAAMHSYHGGKNNLAVPKGWYQNVQLLDIISAYPAAMKALPSFSKRELYKRIDIEGEVNAVHWCGIYKIYGRAKECKWPVVFDHAFKPVFGDINGVWITGPELNEALKKKEVEIDRLYGFYYEAEKDDIDSPFSSYIDYFFSLKAKADEKEDRVTREFAKLMMNSLYGKFMQTRSDKRETNWIFDLDRQTQSIEKQIIAGGLFHPFIGTLITGQVRAWIHDLEHKYSALHTATDGIFTTARNARLSNKLGGLKLEAYGDLLLFRNKLYILYGKKGKIKSSVFGNRSIIKYALHGFRGTVYSLERIYATGSTEYEYKKVNKLRESLRSGLTVNKFEHRTAQLTLNDEETEEKENG